MSVVALVPARGGSKRLPRKNLADCAGRPLLEWAARSALDAARIDHALLSTDDEEVAAAGRGFGLSVPFLRPPEIAADDTPMLPVMQHALAWAKDNLGPVEALVLLQPTSPLRRAEHVDAAVEAFLASDAESLVSVVEISHIHHPIVAYRIDSGRLVPYFPDPPSEGLPAYSRNGPAVLINRPKVLERGERLGEPLIPYLMAPEDSIDVDPPLDLEIAEFLLQRRARKERETEDPRAERETEDR